MTDYFWNTTIGNRWPTPEPPAPNPFERDAQGRIKSPTAIAKAIKQDPAKARILCRNAGEPTSAWFDDHPR